MKNAFEGKLVPQDSSDESAKSLLDIAKKEELMNLINKEKLKIVKKKFSYDSKQMRLI